MPASSIAISGDGLVLAAPAILDLPYVFSALVTVGALAAALAVANATAFAAASALGHDFYGGVIGRRVSGGRQLIVTRLIAAGVVAVATWLAASAGDELFALAPAVLSLSAGTLLAGGAHRRVVATGECGGRARRHRRRRNRHRGDHPGGAATRGSAILDPFGFSRAGINALTAGVIGAPLGAIVTVAVSLFTEAPSEEQQSVTDAIRRPGGTPIVQENESL